MGSPTATLQTTRNSSMPTRFILRLFRAGKEREREGKQSRSRRMMTVVVMAELLEECSLALRRLTEDLLPPRWRTHLAVALRDFRLGTSSSSSSSSGSSSPYNSDSSFIVYF